MQLLPLALVAQPRVGHRANSLSNSYQRQLICQRAKVPHHKENKSGPWTSTATRGGKKARILLSGAAKHSSSIHCTSLLTSIAASIAAESLETPSHANPVSTCTCFLFIFFNRHLYFCIFFSALFIVQTIEGCFVFLLQAAFAPWTTKQQQHNALGMFTDILLPIKRCGIECETDFTPSILWPPPLPFHLPAPKLFPFLKKITRISAKSCFSMSDQFCGSPTVSTVGEERNVFPKAN